MSDHEIVEDFTLQPVPDDETMTGVKIGIVILAIGFTLPLFSVGATVARSRGLLEGAAIFFTGCGLVGLISLFTSVIGARLRVSTYVILERTFGTAGGKLLNLLLIFSSLGWFSNVADLLGTAVSDTLRDTYGQHVPAFACTSLALGLMTVTAIFGFRMMERFASVMLPLLCLFMVYVVILSLGHGSLGAAIRKSGDGRTGVVESISTVVGLVVLTAVLAPDFTRYARDDRAALLSVAGLVFGYPVIMLIAAVPATILVQSDIMRIMVGLGVPGLALVLLTLSTWTSNTSNLYSATLQMATILPRAAIWQLGVGGALAALAAAYFHVSDYFVPFLIMLGIGIVPVTGVYVCEALLCRETMPSGTAVPAVRIANLAAYGIGAAAGYASGARNGLILPIPALDGLLVAVASWLVLNRKRLRRRTATA